MIVLEVAEIRKSGKQKQLVEIWVYCSPSWTRLRYWDSSSVIGYVDAGFQYSISPPLGLQSSISSSPPMSPKSKFLKTGREVTSAALKLWALKAFLSFWFLSRCSFRRLLQWSEHRHSWECSVHFTHFVEYVSCCNDQFSIWHTCFEPLRFISDSPWFFVTTNMV